MIYGFVEKNRAGELADEKGRGTFLLRFRDSGMDKTGKDKVYPRGALCAIIAMGKDSASVYHTASINSRYLINSLF